MSGPAKLVLHKRLAFGGLITYSRESPRKRLLTDRVIQKCSLILILKLESEKVRISTISIGKRTGRSMRSRDTRDGTK